MPIIFDYSDAASRLSVEIFTRYFLLVRAVSLSHSTGGEPHGGGSGVAHHPKPLAAGVLITFGQDEFSGEAKSAD